MNIVRLISEIDPDEIYNLAAQSHVGVSFETPEYTGEVDALGTLRILEACRILKSKAKIYQASTSELFGDSPAPQNEMTAFRPRSPYGAAKLYAYWTAKSYRDGYGMFICNGILFNHESERRGENFVTTKICRAAVRGEAVRLGHAGSIRDWGHAKDYVRGMWLMLQNDKPNDYVLATGQGRTVRHFAELAYSLSGSKCRIEHDPAMLRPLDVTNLVGDATRARVELGWKPEIGFESMVSEMVHAAARDA